MISQFRLWLVVQLFRLVGVIAPEGEHFVEIDGGRLQLSKTKTNGDREVEAKTTGEE